MPNPSPQLSKDDWLFRYRDWFRRNVFGPDGKSPLTKYQLDAIVEASPFEEIYQGFEHDPEGAAQEEVSYWEPDETLGGPQ